MSRDKNYQHLLNSKRWKTLRQWKLEQNPLCELCEREGKVVSAIDVHHKITFVGKGDKTAKYAYDYGNLQALCKECHQAVHNIRKSPI